MQKDIAKWKRVCIGCQKAKVQRHKQTPFSKYQIPDERFQIVHLDLVGLLPSSNGYTYLLTMIDRYSCWPEAIPLRDMTAETVAEAFYGHWIARFGPPVRVTTDQDRQFESQLYQALSAVVGINKAISSPYHQHYWKILLVTSTQRRL